MFSFRMFPVLECTVFKSPLYFISKNKKLQKNYLNLDLGRIVSDVETRYSGFLKGHLKHKAQ